MGIQETNLWTFHVRLRDAGKDRNLFFVRTGLILNSVGNTEEFS